MIDPFFIKFWLPGSFSNGSTKVLGAVSAGECTLYLRGKIHELRDEIDLAIADYIASFRLGVPDKIGMEIQRYISKHKGKNYLGQMRNYIYRALDFTMNQDFR